MIKQEKSNDALYALHLILVRARYMAYENGAKDLALLLDYAEVLPRLIAETEDKTAEYADYLKGIAQICQNLSSISDMFEDSSAPKIW